LTSGLSNKEEGKLLEFFRPPTECDRNQVLSIGIYTRIATTFCRTSVYKLDVNHAVGWPHADSGQPPNTGHGLAGRVGVFANPNVFVGLIYIDVFMGAQYRVD
jgi:hypothetical protein